MTDHGEIIERRLDEWTATLPRSDQPLFSSLGEGRYKLHLPAAASLELDYLRREGGQLKGELLVRCPIAGAKTVDGVLSVGDINLSAPRSRREQAKHLNERAAAKDLDFGALIEELALRVLAAERAGEPGVTLSDLAKPAIEAPLEVDGLRLLERHPTILFGDGGTCKSLLALHIAGKLSQAGIPVLYADWELTGEDHRLRLEQLFGLPMPTVTYARCSRPFVFEAERLRRIARERNIRFLIVDSIAFACDGPPESAEIAGRYFQALRSFGPIGSLHIAHINKSIDQGAEKKPFGSTFWHNGARLTYNVQLADGEAGDPVISVAIHCRKANMSGRRPSIGYQFRFEQDETFIRRIDPASVPELASGLSLPQRLRQFLSEGTRSRAEIVEELGEQHKEGIKKAIARGIKSGKILRLPGPGERFGLPYETS